MSGSFSVSLDGDCLCGRMFRHKRLDSRVNIVEILADYVYFKDNGELEGCYLRFWWSVDAGNLVLRDDRGNRYVFAMSISQSGSLSLYHSSQSNGSKLELWFEELPSRSRWLDRMPNLIEFSGEFGQEIIHFVPFVHWLHRAGEMNGRRLLTFEGMQPFYFFLNPHQIVIKSDPRKYVEFCDLPDYHLHGDGVFACRTGLEWTPDYRAQYKECLSFEKPICVIHNKYTVEWDGKPVNFFTPETLRSLFSILRGKFQIVFFEAARASDTTRGYSVDHQEILPYNDVDVAREFDDVIIFGDLLKERSGNYNELKLQVFSNCYHFITVQGGNSHLCAAFGGSLIGILHVEGRELAHSYKGGHFQYASSPRPISMVCRSSDDICEIAKSFVGSRFVGDRVHLDRFGQDLFQRFNPSNY